MLRDGHRERTSGLRRRLTRRPGVGVSASLLVALLLSACATERERQARAEFREALSRRASQPDERSPESAPVSSAIAALEVEVLRRSPALAAAFERWRAALERAPQVRSLPNPQLKLTHFVEEVETRVGPQRNRIGLMQTVPWPSKLTRAADAASLEAERYRRELEDLRAELVLKTRLAWLDLFDLRQTIRVTRESLQVLESYDAIARIRFRTAGLRHPDVIRVQIEIGSLEDRLQSLEDRRRPLTAVLNALLDRRSDAPIPWPGALPEWLADDAELSLEDLSAEMTRRHPKLAALREQIERAGALSERADAEFFPDLLFGVDVIDTGPAQNRNLRGSGKDPVLLTFGLSLPIWGGRIQAGRREARARGRSARSRLADQTRSLEAALQKALFDRRDAERKVALYGRTLIPKAEEAQRALSAAYQTGEGDFLSLLDIERTLLNYRLEVETAKVASARAAARIQRLRGR